APYARRVESSATARLPLGIGAIPCRPLFWRDVLIAALMRRSLERVFDVFLTNGLRMTAPGALDQRLQVGLAEMVVRDGDEGVVGPAAPPSWRRTGGAAFDTAGNTVMMPMRALSAL